MLACAEGRLWRVTAQLAQADRSVADGGALRMLMGQAVRVVAPAASSAGAHIGVIDRIYLDGAVSLVAASGAALEAELSGTCALQVDCNGAFTVRASGHGRCEANVRGSCVDVSARDAADVTLRGGPLRSLRTRVMGGASVVAECDAAEGELCAAERARVHAGTFLRMLSVVARDASEVYARRRCARYAVSRSAVSSVRIGRVL